MRRFRGALCLLTGLGALACQGPSKEDPPAEPLVPPLAQPKVTAKGTAAGQLERFTVSPAGGSVSSANGAVGLTIPAGALAASTEVTLEPISNFAPGGLGAAFRLAPEGQVFLAPVTVSFTYTEAELAGTVPDALGVAYQDEKGSWRSLKAVALDRSAKTLSVTTTHFSDWSKVIGFQLRPPSSAVDLGGSVLLEVAFCQSQQQDELVTLLADCEPNELYPVASWSVNAVANGNAEVGTLQGVEPGVSRYTAPATEPAANPVSVSAETTFGGKKLVLVASITVGGTRQWEGKVTSEKLEVAAGMYETSTTTVAQVTFGWDEAKGSYTPKGTLTFSYLLKNLAGACQTSASYAGTLTPQDGNLMIGTGNGPSSYSGFGMKIVTVEGTSTCNGSGSPEPTVVASAIDWWPAGGSTFELKPDGTLDESTVIPGGTGNTTVKWHFESKLLP